MDRAQVHQHRSAWCNGVHAPPTIHNPDVEGGFGVPRHLQPRELVDRSAHGMDSARRTKGSPTMPSWSFEGDFQAGATNARRAYLVYTVPFDRDDRVNLSLPGLEQCAYAAQVAQPLFADTGSKDHAPRRHCLQAVHGLRHTQHSGHGDTVVPDARAVQALFSVAHLQGRGTREDRVEMRRYQRGRAMMASTEHATDIVDRINLHLRQADGAHALCHIGSPLRLLKGRGGNVTQMHGFIEHLVKAIR